MFIFFPGIWLGQGKLHFTHVSEPVLYYEKWVVSPMENGQISATQIIELQGLSEKRSNQYLISNIDKSKFQMTLNHDIAGMFQGNGSFTDASLFWQIPQGGAFYGEENFMWDPSGIWTHRATFVSPDMITTSLEGQLWRKT